MSKIFLDANVFIDLLTLRNPQGVKYHKALKSINYENLYISVLSIHIAYYVLKIKPKSKLSENVKNFCKVVNLIPLSGNTVSQAIALGYKDFEDTLQYISAIDSGCNLLLTRDKKDFNNLKRVFPNKVNIVSSLL